MPAKIDTELNLRFLYICFKHSNFSTVDFHEVASYFQIKAPAARMRLMRLRQALEAESSREGFRERDRKRRLNPFKAKDKTYANDGEDDDDESLDDVPLMQRLHARMMRIKHEEGLMIKNEDGTTIKDEDTAAMIKNEDGGFWGKKEEDIDDQEEKRRVNAKIRETGGTPHFKSEINNSRNDSHSQGTSPVDTDDVVKPEDIDSAYVPSSLQQHVLAPYSSSSQGEIMAKPENMSPLNVQHTTPYPDPDKMELDAKRGDYGYGGNQHSQASLADAGPFNFRAYGHANTSSPYVRGHSNTMKPESTNSNGHPAPFHGYNSISRPDVFNPFAQAKPESRYGNTHATPPPGLSSPFRLDMFKSALANSTTSGVETRSMPDYADSVMGSPLIKDDASEVASEKGYPSPTARQSYQNNFG